MAGACNVGIAVLAGLAVGMQARGQSHPELPDQPPAAPRKPVYSQPFTSVTDGITIVQVNTSAAGLNIVGDAANEPSIAIDPTAPNRIAIGWRQFDSVTSNFRQAGYAWSEDGGRSWHFPGSITPGTYRSDPVLESDSDGNFYYYTLPTQLGWFCQLFKSSDGGRTWSGPVWATGGDRAWLTIDKSGGPGDGNIYAIWKPGSIGCCGSNTFGRDTSGGTNPWPNATFLPGQPVRGTVAVGPDGEVYAFGQGGPGFVMVRSQNAWNNAVSPTFDSPVPIALGGPLALYAGPNPGGLLGQPWVDIDRSTTARRGHVYALSVVDPPGTDPCDVMFSRSTDGGQSWSPPVRIHTDPPTSTSYQWFQTLSVAPSGRLDVTYNSTHESGTSNRSRMYYTFSNDGGASWEPAVALTPEFNSHLGWPNQNKLGDYYDQESDDVGVSVAMAATWNGEQDVYFIRINDWDCNRNAVPDSEDLALGTLRDCDGNGIPDECEVAAGVLVNCPCYANCDESTVPPVLNVDDFTCFINQYAAGSNLPHAQQVTHYANCDGSTIAPALNVDDFTCFINDYAAGCP